MAGLVRQSFGVMLVAGLAAAFLSGCGGSKVKLPALAPVTGCVKLDGQPVKNATVIFVPDKARMSIGHTDEQGHYDLVFDGGHHGAAVGPHVVRISLRENDPARGNRELLPLRYNDRTELKANVHEGANDLVWDLRSR